MRALSVQTFVRATICLGLVAGRALWASVETGWGKYPSVCLTTLLAASFFDSRSENETPLKLEVVDGTRFTAQSQPFSGGIDLAYLDALKTLREAVEREPRLAPRMDQVTVIVYPFYGTDSGTPFLVFPNLRLSIGIDENPLVERLDKIEPVYYPHLEGVRQTQVNSWMDKFRMGKIIGGLSVPFPHFRLGNILFFSVGKTRRASRESSAVHAIIEFDDGPGTLLRRHLHLNRNIVDEKTLRFDQTTLAVLDAFHPQGVIGRGAMGALHQGYAKQVPLGFSFHDWIQQWFLAYEAVLFEGRIETADGWEISGRGEGRLPLGAQSLRVEMRSGFGYADEAQLWFTETAFPAN